MKTHQIFILALALLLVGCANPTEDSEQAQQALAAFFENLSKGEYAEAAGLYAGDYENLISFNPDLDPQDHAALWQNGCQVNGLQCLVVRSATFKERTSAGEYLFTVEFSNSDGSLFSRGACCGEDPTNTPPTSQFEYRLTQGEDGKYRVLDMPVYVP